ncbi:MULTISPECIES: PepSY-associated TM helix domain-containing protein [unclassified Novosphingobium]|uniref:PepSY-associated TM helix domain-containing protein n=1 Tax=unclassified Novosphingobium TaxID=2644732 RepID=UPI00146E1D36|nr:MULTISPECIES: PepSY-associated TM helix domain-containing protein [unclassified Novosphingobium]NMN04913.1 putative iron-regulated membrane protein [Novosphingobium sp. SG919]NMN87206.1 putative iron-regulated membrane protein [Novosphingobium sp. SG916]
MTEQTPRNTRSKQWRWPLSPETVRAVLSSHSVLGLAFAAVIYLVCLTGTLVVFSPDLQHWEVPQAPVVPSLSDRAAGRAVLLAERQAAPDATLSLSLPGPARAGATLMAYGNKRAEQTWAVAPDGALVPMDAPWTEFLLHLHVNLHLPRSWGGFIVGLTGVALLSSLVSGILAHPRVVRDAFHLRLGGSRRLQEADLHNRLGVWALPFHFTLALTGALLGLSTLIVAALALLLYRGDTQKVYGLFIDPPPPADARAVPMPDIAALLAIARARTPEAAPQTVSIARHGRADMRITVNSARPRLLVPQDEVQFDARGTVLAEEHPADLALGTKVLGGIGQVHFGWFGGAAVRVAYGLLGLALCVVTSSGVTIWLARRRDRGRAAPQWERIWAAVCWGQPLALMVTAMIAMVAPRAPLPITWLVLTIAIVAGAALVRIDGARLAVGLRRALGAGLVALGLVHAATVGLGPIDGVLCLGGAALLALTWPVARRSAA